jgi:transposase
MAWILKGPVNGRERLYRVFTYRGDKGYPQSNRKLIATYDPKTNQPVFNSFFMSLIGSQGIKLDDILSIDYKDISKVVNFGDFDKLKKQVLASNQISPDININLSGQNTNINVNNNNDFFTGKTTIQIVFSNNKIETFDKGPYKARMYGPYVLLRQIVEDTGLLFVLKDIFPDNWRQILTLSYYLVCSNDPLMYCDQWTEKTFTFLEKNNLQSQRISELLRTISYNDSMKFYESWSNYILESDYLALDVTSVSSYSQLMNLVEVGYNRDNESLPQINYCLLFGEKSGLPVFSSVYSGSINDVSSLSSIIDQIELIKPFSYKLVMDKGFYSKKNIERFINKHPNYEFLIAVPFSTAIAREIASTGSLNFDKSQAFKIGNDIIYGYSFIKQINYNYSLKYHVFYNEMLYHRTYNNKLKEVLALKEIANENPMQFKNLKEYKKYLLFEKDINSDSFNIRINNKKIMDEIKNTGWLIVVGNNLEIGYDDVIKIYRSKDCVEKAFYRFKNCLAFNRIRVHSDIVAESKFFIGFISLIITSYIHKVMVKNKLYSKYTMHELLNSLTNFNLFSNDVKEALGHISNENREILNAFGIQFR